jgi:serine/threonine protein kinase
MSVIIRKTILPREISGIQAFCLWNCYWVHKPIGYTATSTAFVKVCLFCPIPLIIDLPLPDSIYDLLDSMMHQQPKKRPSADEILEKLDELDKSLKSDSKRPHGKIETTA